MRTKIFKFKSKTRIDRINEDILFKQMILSKVSEESKWTRTRIQPKVEEKQKRILFVYTAPNSSTKEFRIGILIQRTPERLSA